MRFGGNLVWQHESLEVRYWGHWDWDPRVVQVSGEIGNWSVREKRYAHFVMGKY